MKKKICALVVSTTLFACGGGSGGNDTPPQSQQPTQNQSQVQQQQAQIAKDYVAEVLQIMRENVITKYEINWAEVEAEVTAMASNAQTISDTYPAITKALDLIKINHSFLYSRSDELVAYHSTLSCNEEVQIPFSVELDNVGYVKVGGFSNPDSDAISSFATGIQNTIARQDTAGIDGWVVDLRENTGGNMWPMIAGLGPLLGDGIHGYFVDADEQYIN